jgi:3-phosphoshikimate 1-carboxyvinyltransferase
MSITLKSNKHVIFTTVTLPYSKSISNRILIIKALTQKKIDKKDFSTADDTHILIQALQQIAHQNKEPIEINVGHAGTAYRFLTAYLCLLNRAYILSGSNRMHQRPIKPLVDALNELGANITYLEKEGYPPLKIHPSNLIGKKVIVKGNISSQYISSLMLIAPYLKNGLTISIEGEIVSLPYLKMTADIMKKYGVSVKKTNNEFVIPPQKYSSNDDFSVELDWSAASYWYSLLALAERGEIVFLNLYMDSLQGDSVVAEIYQQFGIQTFADEKGVKIFKQHKTQLTYFEYNFLNCPDLAQTVFVTCLGLGIDAKFTGVDTLSIKETNRIVALKTEAEKMGASVIVSPNEIHLKCNTFSVNQPVETYHDHRMAMSFAPLVMKSNTITIENEEVVNKSYPNFFSQLRKSIS